jgi:crotonyl-CoA carboxylase/reductase
MARELFDVGEMPPLGVVPRSMHAWVVRPERFGEPIDSLQPEVIDVPSIGEDEVLVYVMAAGVNYNNVWAATGVPQDVIAARAKLGETEPFHVGGSDAAGIVYQVGSQVRDLAVGDEVVVHCGTWNQDCPVVRAGRDPVSSPTFRTWGYQTNWGSFAQFTRVQAHQCLPRPKQLDWASSACYLAVGAGAYRMLAGWGRHAIRPGDVVLCWGGAGGLGSMAIQVACAMGGVPVAVVSSDDKIDYCRRLGARGCINRTRFDHWGMLPHWRDKIGYAKWLEQARAFGEAIWEVLGERRNPRIVFEHPGESTIPTSIFVCERGGMVVTCAGTTGYNATIDLRYLWTRQKRLQGSHFADDEQAGALNELVASGAVDPCLSSVFGWEQLAESHQLMFENRHPHGNMAVLVGARDVDVGLRLAAKASSSPESPPEIAYRPPPADPDLHNPHDHVTRVQEAMHPGVITCPAGATLAEATTLLLERKIHGALVVDHERPVGVVSQTDLVLARQGRSRAEASAMIVRDVMTRGLVSCDEELLLADAVTLMMRQRIHRLFVTARGKEMPVGVLSLTDVLRRLLLPRE